jgi:predicted permease
MQALIQDVRYAFRLLVKDRSFTITAVLTLAICIGANTATFGLIRSVLLKPLPFPGSDRIVYLFNSYPDAGAPRVGTAVPDLFDRLASVPAMDVQALFQTGTQTYGDENGAAQLNSLRGTPSFFRLVQVQPVRGRLFTDAEGEPDQDRKVLLSYGFWQRNFGGADPIVGRTMRLNGQPHEVVGVLPQGFTFLQNDLDIFLPAAFQPQAKSDDARHNNNWQMVGRLKDGATLDQVRQQVEALNARNNERFPQFRQILQDARFHTVSVMLQDDVVRDVKASLYLLWGGVSFVLLIGVANIANLILVRSSGRRQELATRHAVGGDLGRLSRQLVTETTVLALTGGVLGLLIGWWTLRSMSALNLTMLPRGYEIGLDWIAIGYIVAITLAVGSCLGLAPAFRLRTMNLHVELRQESRGGTSSRRANLIRRGLAVVQVALALALLVGAGLLFASFRAVLRLDLGFDPENVMTAAVALPATEFPNPPALVTFEQRALEAIRSLPDVEAAGTTSAVPFGGSINNSVILAEGYVMKPGESLLAPSSVNVNPGYFEALHVELVRGRFIDVRDTQNTPRTVVIDDRLARKFWPDQDPIGRRLYYPTDTSDITKITEKTTFLTIVGVIREIRMIDPRPDITPVGTVYFPWEQQPGRGPTLVVKTRRDVPAIVSSIRRAIATINPHVPVFRERSMREWIDRQLVGRRLPMFVALAFGVVALLLAVIGTYGVLAHSVNERRRELGVRMALGGSSGSVFGLVLRDGVKVIVTGLVLGLVGAYWVARAVQSQLVDVAPLNPVVFLSVAALLLIVGLTACVVPAWRASRINPVVALAR